MSPIGKTATLTPATQPQVPTEVGLCSDSINLLADNMDRLEERLPSVLRSQSPSPDDADGKDLVPLANDIRSIRDRILHVNTKLTDIIARLEL